MARNLPQELTDIIIGNLHGDRRTLRTCSLVCRSWLPTSYQHLFRRVELWPPNSYYARSIRKAFPHCQRLYSILLNSPHVANYIQELKVYEGQIVNHEHWIGTDQTLPLVLRSLTNLKRIEFTRLLWNDLPLDLRRSICGVLELPSLTVIEIEDSRFACMHDFLSILRHAGGQTGLSLSNIHTSYYGNRCRVEEEEERLDSHQQQRSLDNLRLGLDQYSIFINWLLAPQSPSDVSHIHTLHILNSYRQSDAKVINRLLHAIGHSLSHFQIHAPYGKLWNEGSNADISFKYNSGIKFLHIKNFDVDRDAWDPFPWLLHLLSSIRETNQLEEIRLEVDATNRSMDWSAWKEVDCTLASAHFECLRKMNILVWVHGDQYLYKSCEILVGCFPLLTEKGVSVDVR